jgi:AraC-like DNA-binding protein
MAEAARREVSAEFIQLSPGRFHGETTRLELADIRVQTTATSGMTLFRARTWQELIYYNVPVTAAKLVWDGMAISSPVVIQHASEHEYVRTARDFLCVSVAIPRDPFVRDAIALAGASDGPIRLETGQLDPSNVATRKFMKLALDVGQRARRGAGILPDVEYLASLHQRLERSVLDLLVAQIATRDKRRVLSLGNRSRKQIVLRAAELLETAAGTPISMADLCRAADVSERTLRYAFHDVFGVSPQRYMLLWRLRTARRALLESDGSRGSVKVAAYNAGFHELGRFSVHYRRFFGESPSETARHQTSTSPASGATNPGL